MAINGKQGVIEKVDTHTVRFKFPEPYFMFPTSSPAPRISPVSGGPTGTWAASRPRTT
jgi:ABC-type transport system substrate-binding protein